jgi:hypothetical protein
MSFNFGRGRLAGVRQWSSWEWTTWTGSPKGEEAGDYESISAAMIAGRFSDFSFQNATTTRSHSFDTF